MQKQTVYSHAQKKLDPISYRLFVYLVERLRTVGLPTTYEPVGTHLGVAWHHNALGPYLASVTRYTLEQYDFLLSAIVHAAGTGQPGDGFPVFAWELGVRINSPLWYDQELQKMTAWATALT